MKRISLIICSILLLCTSCSNTTRREPLIEASKISGNSGLIREIYKFEYNGHQYISFEGTRGDTGFSVVHDPDCKCKN